MIRWIKQSKQTEYTGCTVANDIITDNNGDIYVVGMFSGIVSFDDIVLYTIGCECFVTKYNKDGKVVWAKQSSGSSINVAYGIAVNTRGEVYITGKYSGETQFGKIRLESDRMTSYVVKIDMNGHWMWAKDMVLNEINVGNAIYISSDLEESIYITGSIGNKRGGYVSKISSTGKWISILRMEGNGEMECLDIKGDGENNIYITGWFKGEINVGTYELRSGEKAGYVIKLKEGICVYGTIMGKNGGMRLEGMRLEELTECIGTGISSDNKGNIYSIITFRGEINVGNTIIKSYRGERYDTAVVYLDGMGNIIWCKHIVTQIPEKGMVDRVKVMYDMIGYIYVCGYFYVDDKSKMYIGKMDLTGEWTWILNNGGEGICRGLGINKNMGNNVYVVGYIQDNIKIDEIIMDSKGTRSMYVLNIQL